MLAHRAAVAALVVVPFGASSAQSQDCMPEIVNTFDTPGKAQRFAIAGDLAAVADGTAGVRFLDISDPTRPRSLSQVQAIFGAEDVAITGDVAAFIDTNFLNGTGFLKIVDISDPRNAQIVFEVHSGKRKPLAVEAWEHIVSFYLFDLDAVVGVLEFYDVSDPTSPVLLSQIQTHSQDAIVRDGLLFATGVGGLFIFDVTDPTTPIPVGSLDIPENGRYMSIEGDIAYVTTGSEGLFIIDIAEPTNPHLLSTIVLTSAANTVAVSESVAYVSFSPNPVGLAVIDVRDPLNPVLIGSIDDFAGAVRGVAIADDQHLLLANSGSGVHTIDIATCEPCPADLDGDTDLDADDFFLYLDGFATGDMTICDIDQDADCDAEDFFAYLDLFAAGC